MEHKNSLNFDWNSDFLYDNEMIRKGCEESEKSLEFV